VSIVDVVLGANPCPSRAVAAVGICLPVLNMVAASTPTWFTSRSAEALHVGVPLPRLAVVVGDGARGHRAANLATPASD
jgi:hypothetical protein